MDLITLFKDIEELGFRALVEHKEMNNIIYRDRQFEILNKIETDIACYKAELRKYDDKDKIIRGS